MMTTVASDSASRKSSAKSTTSAAGVGTPASASTRKRAGSAPDRAGVIDSAKLAAFDPALASNLRPHLAAWIAERERTTGRRAAAAGAAVCLANLAALLVAKSRAERIEAVNEGA